MVSYRILSGGVASKTARNVNGKHAVKRQCCPLNRSPTQKIVHTNCRSAEKQMVTLDLADFNFAHVPAVGRLACVDVGVCVCVCLFT